MTRYFTREEAEELLPEISSVLRKIQEGRERMRTVEEELEILQVQAMGNGHHLFERITRLQSELATSIQGLRAAMNELLEFGCVLKDPDTGLIDFLSLRDGREVYLCWRLGEDRIRFWHDLDGGFAGRQLL
jgi:hypothetical protein